MAVALVSSGQLAAMHPQDTAFVIAAAGCSAISAISRASRPSAASPIAPNRKAAAVPRSIPGCRSSGSRRPWLLPDARRDFTRRAKVFDAAQDAAPGKALYDKFMKHILHWLTFFAMLGSARDARNTVFPASSKRTPWTNALDAARH
ncbi:MAG: hypothetical protein ACK4IS_04290 [Erythrobacter sp.]